MRNEGLQRKAIPELRNMLAPRRLLVATDLSSRAERAMGRAVLAAEEYGATISVLHVLTAKVKNAVQRRQIVLKIEKDLRRTIDELSPRHKRNVTIRVVAGTPFVEIIRHAREEASDIILVGAHGAQFIKDLLFGTTAEKIVRKGDRPVLVVKRPARSQYRRVLVATDFSEPSGQALKLAMKVAPGAKFYLLHAYQGFEEQLLRAGIPKAEILRHRHQFARQSREQMKTFIHRLDMGGKSILRLLRYGPARHVIIGTERHLRPDLICLGSVGRTGLPYILLGSVAEHVLREVHCDVLVARTGSAHFELP